MNREIMAMKYIKSSLIAINMKLECGN